MYNKAVIVIVIIIIIIITISIIIIIIIVIEVTMRPQVWDNILTSPFIGLLRLKSNNSSTLLVEDRTSQSIISETVTEKTRSAQKCSYQQKLKGGPSNHRFYSGSQISWVNV